jgi:hypothetical protein
VNQRVLDYADGSANAIRRTSVTYPNGRVVNYLYNTGDDDGLNRRVSQSTTPLAWDTFTLAEWEAFALPEWETFAVDATTTVRHYYYSDQWQSLEERLGSTPTSAAPDRQFVWGLRYIDDCVLRDRSTTGTINERLYAMQDANWNVVAICNTSAAVLERYAYTAYGVGEGKGDASQIQIGSRPL